jgi:hypothetical protein
LQYLTTDILEGDQTIGLLAFKEMVFTDSPTLNVEDK